MKKLFTLCLLAVTMCAVAQNKKIALLEPREGEGSTEISGMEKAMVRGELRKAIVNHTGYEAFTRADVDQLMKEQDFQRTGLVDDSQVKQLGEMSGADYICVSTLNKSNTEFYLEAYLINVETGGISNPASQYGELIGGKLSNMLPVCQALAQELLGTVNPVVKPTNTQKPTTISSSPSSTSTSPSLVKHAEENFASNSWDWDEFVESEKSAKINNGQLNLVNRGNVGTLCMSTASLPIDIFKDFRIQASAIVPKCQLMTTAGIVIGGCSFTIGSSTSVVFINGELKYGTAKLGAGNNKNVNFDISKKGDILSVSINNKLVYSETCTFLDASFGVFVGGKSEANFTNIVVDQL